MIRAMSGICKFFVLTVLMATGSLVHAGEEVMIDSVLHVRNPAEPPGGIQRHRLEEAWSLDDDDELLLGLPTRVAVDAEKRVHILDAQLNRVHVFSLTGEHLATLSREGDGPGEMRNPSDMVIEDDGSVGIVQEYPGKVVRLDRHGNPLPSVHPGGPTAEGGWCVLMAGRARGDQLVISGLIRKRDAAGEEVRRLFLSSFTPAGDIRATYVERGQPPRARGGAMREVDLLHPFVLAWDVGPDGRVFVATDWERYAIAVYAADGDLERIIEREYQPWRRTGQEKQQILKLFGASGGEAPSLELHQFAPTISLYQMGIQVTDNGELWVHTSRGNRALPDGVLARFDVFDARGHFLRQVEFECPGNPWNDRLVLVSADHVIRVRRFVDALTTSLGPGALPGEDGSGEETTPGVLCYRIRP